MVFVKRNVILINHQYSNVCFLFLANGRAPLEPYYGRYIGNFTEFAHKIKVNLCCYNAIPSTNPYQTQAEIISVYLFGVRFTLAMVLG